MRLPDVVAMVVVVLAGMGATINWDQDAVTVSGQGLHGVQVDMGACPDLTPTVAALAAMAQGQTRIFGAAHLRLKESDRISAPAGELRKVGCIIDETADGMTITPPSALRLVSGPETVFCTHNDHRLAMSLTLLTRRGVTVRLDNPGCVDKSFPDFNRVWRELEGE